MSILSEIRSNTQLENPETPRCRFFMVLSFDGTPFNGWQIQPSAPSVQEEIENALRITLKIPLHIVGAGRTDTGVNARYMTAHFDTPVAVGQALADNPQQIRNVLKTLNAIVRPSIAVYHLVPVATQCHARFDAVSRTYRYYLHTVPDPFRDRQSRFFHRPLDIEAMNDEAKDLLGTQDFTSFSKLHTDTNNNICTVSHAQWQAYGDGHFYFEITANRFLRNMVRAIVGTLLDVGTGIKKSGHIREVLEAKDRCQAGASVPGYALYLWDIKYPYPVPDTPLPNIL